ncbi:DUF2931 family protein [Pseudomonas frederiksbergensis]|uniref:DUF2931 family protein n=1 Tax=Pseudomonas frederiksbergensis TaxID=104087 RepID=UPI000F48EEA6|nr:DUF2931 family protein [Pseudomonas frederiksbergensis]RON43685.1 hypothetical protein BK667_28475 [Pseudomonas frederiksbergensis]
MRVLVLFLGMLLVIACQATDSQSKSELTRKWWSLSFNEPNYMKVWVEDSTVEDINGKLFPRRGGGRAAGSEPEDGTESARGWGEITGGVREVVGADLPKRIYVRWQSVVEPQTYRVWIDIPEEARKIMRESMSESCPTTPDEPAGTVSLVYVGLAPGGIAQVWVSDKCMKAVKVARAQAEIEPLGPHLGKSGGNYYPQSEKSKRYVERFGIPYGSW